jgi:pimeloyl-ACP methyl ester carboxylesterase
MRNVSATSRGPRLILPLAAAILGACAGDPPAPALSNGSFTAELNGFRIHYAVHGTGPVLMTVPNSWGLSHEGLRAMFRPLEERLTVVYFDPRGMGGSGPVREDADRGMDAVRADFHALREHLGLETVHAIGWSNGAANLIYLAHERPEALASAIFVHGGASFTAEDGEWIQREHPELMRAFGEFTADVASNPALSVEEKTARLRQLWLETYFPRIAADTAAAGPLLAATFADAGFSWPHAEYTQRTTPGFDARGLLADIPVRSLVIAGAHDLLPPDRIRPLADGLPDAELVVFDASGHFAPIEEPDAFRDAVFRFLGVGGQEAGVK